MGFFDGLVDFGKDILGAGASALGGSLGGAAGNIILGDPEPDYSQEEILEQITLGNKLDIRNQKEMFDYRINQGVAAGMTPFEMYMGPAAGAGGGTTGSGQTLGNAATAKNQAQIQAEMQQRSQIANNTAALAQTKMQTDAQRDVAKIQAGATEYGADLQYNAQMVKNAIERDKLETVVIPMAAANIGKTEKETERIINEIATSEPKFVLRLKELTMGVDNQLAEMLKLHYGISLNDPSTFRNKSESERKEIISYAMAIQSGVAKNIEGVKDQIGLTDGFFDVLGNGIDKMNQMFPDPFGGYKRKPSVQKKGRRGVGARM